MSLPRMDGPSVFAAILDRHAGRFRVGPRDEAVPTDRRYLPGHHDPRDDMGHADRLARGARRAPVGPWHHDEERSHRYARAPRDHEAEHVLLRTLRCLDGFVDLEIDCEPAFDYGRSHGGWRHEATATATASARRRGMQPMRCGCAPICGSGSRAAGARRDAPARRRARVLRARLERAPAAGDLR